MKISLSDIEESASDRVAKFRAVAASEEDLHRAAQVLNNKFGAQDLLETDKKDEDETPDELKGDRDERTDCDRP